MAATQGQLELTARGIPVSLRAFFQEYELESLDPERSAFTLMERTLAWGDAAELRWLFGLYGKERLAGFVQRYGWRALPRRRFKFWVCYFGLTAYEQGERIWPH